MAAVRTTARRRRDGLKLILRCLAYVTACVNDFVHFLRRFDVLKLSLRVPFVGSSDRSRLVKVCACPQCCSSPRNTPRFSVRAKSPSASVKGWNAQPSDASRSLPTALTRRILEGIGKPLESKAFEYPVVPSLFVGCCQGTGVLGKL